MKDDIAALIDHVVRYYIMAVVSVPIGLAFTWDYAKDFYWHASPAEWIIALYCFAVYLIAVPPVMALVMETFVNRPAEDITERVMKKLKEWKK